MKAEGRVMTNGKMNAAEKKRSEFFDKEIMKRKKKQVTGTKNIIK